MHRLIGLKITNITGLNECSDNMVIEFENGFRLAQYHSQDCCETVDIAQVDGDFERHIGAYFTEIREKVVDLNEDEFPREEGSSFESATATFYTLLTSKGYLDWRWIGQSNGYYSEAVSMRIYEPESTD